MIVPHNLVPPLLLCLHYFPLTLLIYCNLGFASSDYLETELLKVTIPLKNKINKQKTLVALCQSDFPHHKVFNTQEETLTLSSALAFVVLFHCGLPTSHWPFIFLPLTIVCFPKFLSLAPRNHVYNFFLGNFIHFFNSFNYYLYVRDNQISNFNPILTLNFWYQIFKFLLISLPQFLPTFQTRCTFKNYFLVSFPQNKK